MQFEITDRAAVLFASEFYAMLAEGQPIDSAISEARLAIWADSNDVEWGTPVLFMRVADGRLFNVTHAAALPRPSPQDLPPKPEVVPEEPPKDETEKLDDEIAVEQPPLETTPPSAETPPIATTPPITVAPPVSSGDVDEPAVARGGLADTGGGTTVIGPPIDVPPPPIPAPHREEVARPKPEKEAGSKDEAGPGPIVLPRTFPRATRTRVAIGLVAAIVVLFVASRILFPPGSDTGSLAVSTDGTLQTGLVFLSGSGFAASEPVDIYLDGAPATTIDAEPNGSFEGELSVGTQRTGTVSAIGRNSHNRVNTDFKVEVASASGSPTASGDATPGASESHASTGPAPPGILFYSDVDQESGTKTVGKQIYLLDPVTGNVDRLTNNVFDDTFPTWSPDYAQIAFARGKVGKRDIYIRDVNGEEGSERALVTGATDDWFPAWSKDGLVAFARADPGAAPATATLWVIKSDGTERAARKVPGVVGRAPAWSGKGTRLAFMSDRAGTNLDVAIVQPNGDGLAFLRAGIFNERNPTWSPDDQQIVFVSDEGGNQEIYLLDVATNTVSRRLTENKDLDGNPVWSPDGKEIAFFREMSTGVYHLWKINVETGDEDDLMPNAVGQNMDPNWR
jgi:hypothetical protein